MDKKSIPARSTSEKPASNGSDKTHEPHVDKYVESFSGVDEKMVETEGVEKAEHDANVVDWDGKVYGILLFPLFLLVFVILLLSGLLMVLYRLG